MTKKSNYYGRQVSSGTMAADMIVSSISLPGENALYRSSASTKQQVLQKAAAAMLSKTQGSSQNILTLLHA